MTIRETMAFRRKLTRNEKGTLAAIATNAVWPRKRLMTTGYSDTAKCIHCQEGDDTLFRRV